jgi:hypothetical protein
MLMDADIAELYPRTHMMRLETDMPPERAGTIHYEAAHRLAVERH